MLKQGTRSIMLLIHPMNPYNIHRVCTDDVLDKNSIKKRATEVALFNSKD
jgi:hypothetical protein